MCVSISWVDYTLSEAVKRAVAWPQLALIVHYLKQMSVYTGDICLDDWEMYLRSNSAYQDMALSAYLKKKWRIKIYAGQGSTKQALYSGFSKIVLSLCYIPGQSDKLLEAELRALREKEVYLELKNACEYSSETLKALWPLLEWYDVKGLLYSDMNSTLDAANTLIRLTELKNNVTLPIEFHAVNAYGLATANALSALRAGISLVAVSVGGVGNYTALEEVWLASKYFLGYDAPPKYLADSCRKILSLMGLSIPGNKAIIGQDIFAHESGIHVDGVTKNPVLYEAFSPEEVGLTRKLVIGKHSGSAALRHKLQQWHLSLTSEQTKRLLMAVRQAAAAQKAAISDYQLRELYFKTVNEV